MADSIGLLQGTDFSQKRAELTDWDKIGWNDDLDVNLEELLTNLKKASYAEWEIGEYKWTCALLNDSFFSLVALGFLMTGASRQDILECLDEQSWATKHEVLARWGWMVEHQKLLRNGVSIPEPYSCLVARRGKDGRRTDREFHTLISFLHWLRFVTGRELLFSQKDETPDFLLEDKSGNIVGAEMTEASISDAWDSEQDTEQEFFEVIKARLGNHLVNVHVLQPASWRALRSRLSEFDFWLHSEAERIGLVSNDVVLKNKSLNLQITLTPSPERLTYIASSSLLPTGDYSQEMHATLRRRIGDKIRRDGKTRKTPFRPCYLVIYPNGDLSADLERVTQEFFQHPPIRVASHFDEIWLSGETRVVQLL